MKCTVCGSRMTRPLNDFDQARLRRDHALTRFCSECLTHTKWQFLAGKKDAIQGAPAMEFSNGVLIVGSGLHKLRQVQATLETCGADAEIVVSFEEALTRIARHDFDLIISEHSPPAFDATRIMSFLQQHRSECVTQICFILPDNTSPEEMEVLIRSGVEPWSENRAGLSRNAQPVGSSGSSGAPDKVQDQGDYGHHQQNVDQSTGDVEDAPA